MKLLRTRCQNDWNLPNSKVQVGISKCVDCIYLVAVKQTGETVFCFDMSFHKNIVSIWVKVDR